MARTRCMWLASMLREVGACVQEPRRRIRGGEAAVQALSGDRGGGK